MNYKSTYLSFLLLLLSSLLPLQVLAAETVAMVTDIVGEVAVNSDGQKKPLNILDNVATGMQIDIAEQAKLVLVYLDSGKEYAVQGKTMVNIGAKQINLESGQSISGKDLNKYRDVQFKPVNALQAAAEMRSGSAKHIKLRLLSLNGVKTLQVRPTFRWQAIKPGLKYQFELFNTEGETLLEKQLTETSLQLPQDMLLSRGKIYSWEISTQLPNRKRYTNFTDFSVVSKKEFEMVNKLRPDESASVAELVLYASVLEQLLIRDEASRYWKKIISKRGAQPNLKNLVEK